MIVDVHPTALCEAKSVGDGTRIGPFSHVLPGACIGNACTILDRVFIAADVVVGGGVSIDSGAHICRGVVIEEGASIGPNATFSEDGSPEYGGAGAGRRTAVGRGARIGANATILSGVTIGPGASIGAGAVVTRSVPAQAVVRGNPARIVGHVDAWTPGTTPLAPTPGTPVTSTGVRGVTLHQLPLVRDMRGDLCAAEFEKDVPFAVRRYFMVFDVPTEDARGEHAHRECHQFLLCARGRCRVVVDDGDARAEVSLDRVDLGLYVPPLVWAIQYRHSADALLLVFASHYYDAADYIRDYDDFLSMVKARRR